MLFLLMLLMLMLLMSFVSSHRIVRTDDGSLRIWASKINKNVITGQAKCNTTNRIWPTSELLLVAATVTVLFVCFISLFNRNRTLLSFFFVHSFAHSLIADGD